MPQENTFKATGVPTVPDNPPRSGWQKINGEWVKTQVRDQGETRIPNRPGRPKRTVSECKQAALEMIDQSVWNLQGLAEKDGLTEYEEQRLLKLLSGLNAALPKNAEEAPIDLSKLSPDQLKAMLNK